MTLRNLESAWVFRFEFGHVALFAMTSLVPLRPCGVTSTCVPQLAADDEASRT